VRLKGAVRTLIMGAALAVAGVWIFAGAGSGLYAPIHDNLDQQPISTARVMQMPGVYFATRETAINQIMNGVPRACLGSAWKIQNLVYRILPPVAAYEVNEAAVRLIGLAGMYLFLGLLIGPRNEERVIRGGCALLFAGLPHYLPTGATVAGLPLVLWALARIESGRWRVWHWGCVAFYPIYASLAHLPLFLLGIGFAGAAGETIVRRKWRWRAAAALSVMAAVFWFSERDAIVMNAGGNGYISHRAEIVWPRLRPGPALAASWNNVINGQEHVRSLHNPIILVAIGLALSVGRRRELTGRLAGLAVLAALLSLWYGLCLWAPMVDLKLGLGGLGMLNWQRLHWLHPVVWSAAFAVALCVIRRKSRIGHWVAIALLLAQAGVVGWNLPSVKVKREGGPSFSQFFAVHQFQQIRDFIGREPSSYRVASLGLEPSIALFNGFFCLDGYLQDYPASYKARFRRVIAPELEKNPAVRAYFDGWGSRCYLFSDELQRQWALNRQMFKALTGQIETLNLDLGAFKDLGGEYIFSAVEIRRAAECDLRLLKIFDGEGSAWRIYLYETELGGHEDERRLGAAVSGIN